MKINIAIEELNKLEEDDIHDLYQIFDVIYFAFTTKRNPPYYYFTYEFPDDIQEHVLQKSLRFLHKLNIVDFHGIEDVLGKRRCEVRKPEKIDMKLLAQFNEELSKLNDQNRNKLNTSRKKMPLYISKINGIYFNELSKKPFSKIKKGRYELIRILYKKGTLSLKDLKTYFEDKNDKYVLRAINSINTRLIDELNLPSKLIISQNGEDYFGLNYADYDISLLD